MCYPAAAVWRYARTKVRELRKLGTFLNAAISVAMSRKGPWHLARTLATQSGMSKIPSSGTNQWLMDQGASLSFDPSSYFLVGPSYMPVFSAYS